MLLKNSFLFWRSPQVGLQELFSFKQKNPHVDLEPFLAQSSQYFRCVFAHFLNTKDHLAIIQVLSLTWIDCSSSRDYIERGLRKIEEEGCAVPISSIGGIGGELNKALLLHVFFCDTESPTYGPLFPQVCLAFLPQGRLSSRTTLRLGDPRARSHRWLRSKTQSAVLAISHRLLGLMF